MRMPGICEGDLALGLVRMSDRREAKYGPQSSSRALRRHPQSKTTKPQARGAYKRKKQTMKKAQQPMKRRAGRTTALGLAGLVGLLTLPATSRASGGQKDNGNYEFTAFNVPTTVPVSPGIGTTAFGINNRGQIVGNFPTYAPDGVTVWIAGFLFEDGKFIDLSIPGSPWTELIKINDHGVAVGDYLDPDQNTFQAHHFVRRVDGTIQLLPPVMPGAGFLAENIGINNQGTIVGSFDLADGVPQGFILNDGAYSIFNYPGAAGTFLREINNSGTILGFWLDAQGNLHGFLRDSKGSLAPIEMPGAGVGGTFAFGLNNIGEVVGMYFGTDSNLHGFVLSHGVYITLDAPNDGGYTAALGINDEGVIVGSYGPGGDEGLIATPVRRRSNN